MRIFKKYNLIVATVFVVGFILILLNNFSTYLNLAALILFFAGFVMMSIPLFKNAKTQDLITKSDNEELVMELSVEDGKEQYVLEQDNKPKKVRKFKDNLRIYLPGIVCVVFAILFLVAIITSIIKLV